ncbi:MAG: nucleotide exchange factor GrpE [Proteobacteria bacterium]|nr:nucleotide exchange factor GrpE [Pseudomonadota bacterium]
MNPQEPLNESPEAAPADDGALARADAEIAELKDAYLRAKAETENVRRQGQADVAKAHKYAVERFAGELLPVKDALEQTLATPGATPDQLRTGVELTLKQLQSALAKTQITEIAAAGEKFDPHRHQAMAMVDADVPANTVVQVFQKGYLINDRVLRPALVAVAKPKADAAAEAEPAPGAA